jgi:hypothetical protein
MAMMTREPGFLGKAKRNAQRQGMLSIPKRWTPQGGEEEYPAFVTQKEMAMLKQQGGSGQMSPYGIPSFDKDTSGYGEDEGASAAQSGETGQSVSSDPGATFDWGSIDSNDSPDALDVPSAAPPKKPEYSIGYNDKKDLWGNIQDINIPGWIEQEWNKLDFGWLKGGKPKKDLTEKEKLDLLKDSPDAQQQIMQSLGGPDAGAAAEASAKEEAYAKDRGEDYEEKKRLKDARQASVDEYGGYKTEVENLGKDSKELTEGTMQDDEGRGPDDPNYDETTGKMRGGFAGDVGKLDKYEDKFGDIAAGAKERGDTAQGQYGGVMTDAQGNKVGDAGYDASSASIKGGAAGMGATALENLGKGVMTDASGKTADDPNYDASSATMQGGYKQVTGQGVVNAAAKGTAGFNTGATDVGTVQTQFGKEGFQKDLKGMSEKALSGEVGQREAGMLKGQMEQQRMASQKGSEEKLRRELAQSGASPSEIAQKVAQFQQQSAAQQQQAGRTEALSSQLQGQQMGQSSLAQAAGLKGQEAGLANTSATLAGQKAALTGKGAAMAMDAAGTQDKTKLAALAGEGDMTEAGAKIRMEGIKGGAELGFKGSEIQGDMLGKGVDSITASGVAKDRVAGGIDQQADMVGDQAEFTQAELDDTIAQQTSAATKESERITRSAQGTPDDPYYRPPTEIEAADTGDLPPGTTVALEPPDELDPPIEAMAQGGPVQGGKPYIVGEEGKEIFTPSQSGNITPNHQLPTQLQGAQPPQGQGVGVPQQVVPAPPQGGLSPMQQGGMMGQPPQGNNPQSQVQGVGGSMMGQTQTGIAQQGGLMGQNQNMSPEQQQVMEAQNKKKRQMGMQSFQMR